MRFRLPSLIRVAARCLLLQSRRSHGALNLRQRVPAFRHAGIMPCRLRTHVLIIAFRHPARPPSRCSYRAA
jgi:hypothetical protein